MIRFAENLNKMIAAGLGGALEAPRTEVAVGHCIRYLEASGPVASFESNIAAPIRNLRVTMEPIQAGSGDPSPDNIRPITGRDEVSVWRTGVNVLDESTVHMSYNYRFFNVPLGENNRLYMSLTDKDTSVDVSDCYLGFTDIDESSGRSYQWVIQNGTVSTNHFNEASVGTVGKLCKFVFVYPDREDVWNRLNQRFYISVNYPSTDHDYHAYDGQSVTVQLGQTVYGGTVDVTGVLTVEWENIASYDGEALPGEWISDRDAYAPGTTPTTGAQVCYKLATPITIDLTPAQLTTLKGQNNVWSDAGDVTLEYPYYEETEGY